VPVKQATFHIYLHYTWMLLPVSRLHRPLRWWCPLKIHISMKNLQMRKQCIFETISNMLYLTLSMCAHVMLGKNFCGICWALTDSDILQIKNCFVLLKECSSVHFVCYLFAQCIIHVLLFVGGCPCYFKKPMVASASDWIINIRVWSNVRKISVPLCGKCFIWAYVQLLSREKKILDNLVNII
jgi:hypothetical protein